MASIHKRSKTYQFTVSHTVNGKSKPIRKGGFRTKKEAQLAAIVLKINKKRSLQSVRNVDFTALASNDMIPVVGVEPTLLTEHDFESCISNN